MSEVRFLETHSDVFVGGKNHGKKLRPNPSLKLWWDEKAQSAYIEWNKETGRIFTGNICLLVEGAPVELPKNEHKTESIEGRRRAQVSTPMGHVFEGPGSGKKRN